MELREGSQLAAGPSGRPAALAGPGLHDASAPYSRHRSEGRDTGARACLATPRRRLRRRRPLRRAGSGAGQTRPTSRTRTAFSGQKGRQPQAGPLFGPFRERTISSATTQLSLTTCGTSSRCANSFKIGRQSPVAIPPSASAASCRTMSSSCGRRRTSIRDGTESGDESWPNTNAISCLVPGSESTGVW